MLREGPIVDATMISTTSSTKNITGKRDPKMLQTKRGKRMELRHEDARWCRRYAWLIHSIDNTAANVHDIVASDKLLHGEEQRVFGDAGCRETGKNTQISEE